MTRYTPLPLAFDELTVGDEWESPGRTITETDVVMFAGISGDYNPLHTDHEFSKSGPFGRPVAHGLLGLAVATGLLNQSPKVDTLAFLAILEWKFLLPIGFGDTIRVVSRIEEKTPQAKGRRGVVTWLRRVVNQSGQVVQEGRTQTLVRGRTGKTAAPMHLPEPRESAPPSSSIEDSSDNHESPITKSD